MAKKQRHAYTEEFRREAVRRSDQPGNTATSVAKELGLHPGQIYNWRRQFSRLSEKQFNSLSGVDYSKQESEEVRRLKRELHDARKENEFLKKLLRTSRSSRSEDRRWPYLATVMDLYPRGHRRLEARYIDDGEARNGRAQHGLRKPGRSARLDHPLGPWRPVPVSEVPGHDPLAGLFTEHEPAGQLLG